MLAQDSAPLGSRQHLKSLTVDLIGSPKMYKAEQADCIRIMAVFSQDVRKTKVFVDEFRGRPTRTLHVFLINKKATSNLFGLLISLRTDLMQF